MKNSLAFYDVINLRRQKCNKKFIPSRFNSYPIEWNGRKASSFELIKLIHNTRKKTEVWKSLKMIDSESSEQQNFVAVYASWNICWLTRRNNKLAQKLSVCCRDDDGSEGSCQTLERFSWIESTFVIRGINLKLSSCIKEFYYKKKAKGIN